MLRVSLCESGGSFSSLLAAFAQGTGQPLLVSI